MIKADIRNCRNNGFTDIGRIQTTTKTHFKNTDIDIFILKVEQCDRGSDFKKRHTFIVRIVIHLTYDRLDTVNEVTELRVCTTNAVD